MSQLPSVSAIASDRTPGKTFQLALLLPISLIIISGCQSGPPKEIEVSPSSSVLGVETCPTIGSLTSVLFIKEPQGGDLQGVTETIAASWVRRSRAYLLNPEPGTYYVVATIWKVEGGGRAGVSVGIGGGVSIGVSVAGSGGEHAVILPKEMILQTRTTIAPSGVEFIGVLCLPRGDRINANAELQDDLQRKVTEIVRPGVTSATGLSGYLTSTWMPDLEISSLAGAAGDCKRLGRSPRRRDGDRSRGGRARDQWIVIPCLEKFELDAADDFAGSPWSQFFPRRGDPERTK